jgi:predicted nucleic acid-binding protein
VTAIIEEPKSNDVRSCLGSQKPEDLAISDWVVAEFSSALSMKLRTKQIDLDGRASGLRAFSSVSTNSVNILPITSAHFHLAARFADNHVSGIRAADALHLAIAADAGATLCTLDQTLAAAGPMLGTETKLL